MSDESNILKLEGKTRLSADITLLMLKGAGYAAVFIIAIWLVLAVIAGIGRALPPESREAADPTPWSSMAVEEEAAPAASN